MTNSTPLPGLPGREFAVAPMMDWTRLLNFHWFLI